MEKLAEELGLWTEGSVQSKATLIAVLCICRASENIARSAGQTRARHIILQRISRDPVDPVHGNLGVDKGLSAIRSGVIARRVINDRTRAREIPAEHRGRGGVANRLESCELPQRLVKSVESQPISPERSSCRTAELIQLHIIPFGRENIPGVQHLIAKEFVSFAVKLIAPALCNNVDKGWICAFLGH